jgi:hypothetical protein
LSKLTARGSIILFGMLIKQRFSLVGEISFLQPRHVGNHTQEKVILAGPMLIIPLQPGKDLIKQQIKRPGPLV